MHYFSSCSLWSAVFTWSLRPLPTTSRLPEREDLAEQPSVLPFAARSIPHSRLPAIIAVGEASHGGEPMLLARNRLIHELAEKGRISWVALETGYAEALLLDRFVRGGPGTVSDVAAKGFTWGFGNLAGNVAL